MRLKLLTIMLATSLVACDKPDLPDPRVSFPVPPAALMEPPKEMKEIPTQTPQGD